MTNTIIPGKPPRPIRVDVQAQPAVSVDASGRIPPGGTAGQNLVKVSDSDFATGWATLTAEASWGAITGTLSAQTDLQSALDGKQPVATVLTNTTAAFTTAQETKLAGIATGATANAADAFLLDRANHTGTQLAATITGLATVATTGAYADLTGRPTLGTAAAENATAFATAAQGALADSAVQPGDLAAIATSGSASDLSAGTLPAARFDDTAHGSRAGGALHADAVASGAAGFMTGADKAKLDGIASGAQVNVATDLTYTAATRVLASSTGTDATLPLFTSTDAGLVPASGGGTANFLRADGTFAAPPGGGGSPGGSSGEVQWNDGGTFAGAADVEIEGGQLRLPAIATPTAPAAGGVKVFGQYLADRPMPFAMDTVAAFALQPALFSKRVALFSASGNGQTDTSLGLQVNATGTLVGASVAQTNLHTELKRREYGTSTLAGWRVGTAQYSVGGAAAGRGGFFMAARWAPALGCTNALHRTFCGMRGNVAAPTDVDPSSLTDIVGVGYDDTDTEVQFIHNDASGVATKVALGASFPKPSVDRTSVFDVFLYSPPGTTQSLSYLVVDVVSGATASGTVTTDLPATSVLMTPLIYASAGGAGTTTSLMVSQVYLEVNQQ